MITVFSTPFAFIRPSSVSGAASRTGTLAPCANGKAGSCFQTCTCGSMMRYVGAAVSVDMAAPARKVRRLTSDINRFQLVHHVLRAALVAGAWPLARDVEIDAEPPLKVDRLQHPMTRWEIDRAVAQIEHVLCDLAGDVPGILIVEKHKPRLVLLKRLGDIAIRQIEVRRIRRKV